MLETRSQIQELFLRLSSEQQEQALRFVLSMLEAAPGGEVADQESTCQLKA